MCSRIDVQPPLLKLKAFCLSEVQMRRKFAHFCYPVNCFKYRFLKNIVGICLISVWSHFIRCYTATKSGGSEALDFKKWGARA